MPRRCKQKKVTTVVMVNNTPVNVTLHPPKGKRKSWYAYWKGLITNTSTGQADLDEALKTVERMVREGGRKATLQDAILTDEEFIKIQHEHYTRHNDQLARKRAVKTLEDCLDSINAFKSITALPYVASATPDDCARFQKEAMRLPKNWRHQQLPREGERRAAELISPNTVLKWSRQLQAAFERANRNAQKKRCVRGVVDEQKLLTSNPWNQFTWIGGRARDKRHFDDEELLSLLTFFETRWKPVPAAAGAAKVFLWSACRKMEVASLSWDSLRFIEGEYHFDIIGKRGVRRWFRVPEAVHQDLLALRTDSPFVFAAYTEQLRQFYASNPSPLRRVRSTFTPENFGQWFYDQVVAWAEGKTHVFIHTFRKTVLQFARRGEDLNRDVARDAGVSEGVMLANYVEEGDDEFRARSNRTYHRILASLPLEVANRYGGSKSVETVLEKQLQNAVATGNWDLAQVLLGKLSRKVATGAG